MCGGPLATARPTEMEEGASLEQPLEHSGPWRARQVWDTGAIPVAAPDLSDLFLAYDWDFCFRDPGKSINPSGVMEEASWFFGSSRNDSEEAVPCPLAMTALSPCGNTRAEPAANGAKNTGMGPPLGPASGSGSPEPLSSEVLLPQSSPGPVVEPVAQGGATSPTHHSHCGSLPPLTIGSLEHSSRNASRRTAPAQMSSFSPRTPAPVILDLETLSLSLSPTCFLSLSTKS